MKRLAIIMAMLLLTTAVAASAQGAPHQFSVVQALGYKGLNLSKYGIRPLDIAWQGAVLPPGSDKPYDTTTLRWNLASVHKGPIPTVLDVERWYLWDNAAYKSNTGKVLNVLSAVRKARPDLQLGLFSLVPPSMYYPGVNLDDETLQRQWDTVTNNVMFDIVPHVDAVYPALYTYSADKDAWEKYALMQLQTARQFNKPVYCFLWPQYYSYGKRGPYLDRSFWRLQLDTCRQYADGIVLYDEPQGKPWNPNAAWWQETMSFMQALRTSS